MVELPRESKGILQVISSAFSREKQTPPRSAQSDSILSDYVKNLNKSHASMKSRIDHQEAEIEASKACLDSLCEWVYKANKLIKALKEKMDKLIAKVEKDVKAGKKGKAEKDIKVLKKADKVQDKIVAKAKGKAGKK